MPFFLSLYICYFKKLNKKLFFAAIFCCLIFTFSTHTVSAQTTGKKLETVKKEKRKVNKKARKRGKGKEGKGPDKEVPQRNSKPRESVKENAGGRKPRGKESTQEVDPARNAQNRPFNAETEYKGGIKQQKKGNNSFNASSYQGGLKQKGRGKNTKATNFEGDIKAKRTTSSYAASTHRGDIKYKKSRPDTKATRFSGNIKVKRDVNSFGASSHRGDLRIRSARNRANYFKKLSAKAHLYEGKVKLGKASKEMHPSAAYKGGKVKNSFAQKERLRNRKLWWSRKDKNAGQPKHLKEKNKKPKYDSRESEIWYY